jgi:uridine phosphorylase
MSTAASDGPFVPHHLCAEPADFVGNSGRGRFLLLPGSDGRAASIAERLTGVTVKRHPRAHNLYLGRLEGEEGPVDVGVVSTGMGTPSLDIVATELFRLGARRFVRVGTCGSLQPRFLRQGALVIPTAAVRDESTSRRYLPPEFPAVASRAFLRAVEEGLAERGEAEVHLGICHSKDSLFAREFGAGPLAPENRRYMEILAQGGVLASEMEAAHLFVLGSVFGQEARQAGEAGEVLCGAVLAVIGDDQPFADPALAASTVERAIDFALDTLRVLARADRSSALTPR